MATTSGSTWTAIAKPRRAYMPDEYVFTGLSMKRGTGSRASGPAGGPRSAGDRCGPSGRRPPPSPPPCRASELLGEPPAQAPEHQEANAQGHQADRCRVAQPGRVLGPAIVGDGVLEAGHELSQRVDIPEVFGQSGLPC